ncbi:hypothetical protein JCM10212_004067 [Sporobolomyces blumeae]
MPPFGLAGSSKLCTVATLPNLPSDPTVADPIRVRILVRVVGRNAPSGSPFILCTDPTPVADCSPLVVDLSNVLLRVQPPEVKDLVLVSGSLVARTEQLARLPPSTVPFPAPPFSSITSLPRASTLDSVLVADRIVRVDESTEGVDREAWDAGVRAVGLSRAHP